MLGFARRVQHEDASEALALPHLTVFDAVGIIVGKAGRASEVVSPRFRARRQDHAFALALNQDLVAGEAVLFPDEHRLAAPGREDLGSPRLLFLPAIYQRYIAPSLDKRTLADGPSLRRTAREAATGYHSRAIGRAPTPRSNHFPPL